MVPEVCSHLTTISFPQVQMIMDEIEATTWSCIHLRKLVVRIIGLDTKEKIDRALGWWMEGVKTREKQMKLLMVLMSMDRVFVTYYNGDEGESEINHIKTKEKAKDTDMDTDMDSNRDNNLYATILTLPEGVVQMIGLPAYGIEGQVARHLRFMRLQSVWLGNKTREIQL
jgi:hypothetical protein